VSAGGRKSGGGAQSQIGRGECDFKGTYRDKSLLRLEIKKHQSESKTWGEREVIVRG